MYLKKGNNMCCNVIEFKYSRIPDNLPFDEVELMIKEKVYSCLCYCLYEVTVIFL